MRKKEINTKTSIFENMSENDAIKLQTYLSSVIELDDLVFRRVDDIHWEVDGNTISERELINLLFKYKDEKIIFR